ncbi:Protein disulfide-isomerase [Monocercomonoides exilis]|uniref:Protein disulfide-isomerase n=1 Tax=Monocercomonoides exilis TaxID=2049356 RepID=UPI00355A3B5D|nr:Protein disulfide-isomerase [Monocercomonoides exilis]|eukprot:MONOS_10103.1-p1 / transcript=MONOS_10103.1 / gene=MONOS_10103 / organism=Monocercomonoides_exilis_PA203 / gene_product=Protein disulfide-isomerase / transcript_product=Protein disulfide-isomerase / location=Mono_scaffold00444:37608-39031(-) / protein_length=422 / sequence_SO=supercontig / SO=protein_coding / is_pseudo=false
MKLILCLCFLIENYFCGDAVELDTNNFKNEVLMADNIFFVMFHTTNCYYCVQMMPEFEKLATAMKSIGIFVGKVNLDQSPQLKRIYNINGVPRMLLFVPGKAPIAYDGERSAKAMGLFIIQHQLGGAQVTVLNKIEKFDNFFNESAILPRIVLFSKKSVIPPLFKQICYKYRKNVRCGMASHAHSAFKKVEERMKKISDFDDSTLNFPFMYLVNRSSSPVLSKISSSFTFESLDSWLSSLNSSKDTSDALHDKNMNLAFADLSREENQKALLNAKGTNIVMILPNHQDEPIEQQILKIKELIKENNSYQEFNYFYISSSSLSSFPQFHDAILEPSSSSQNSSSDNFNSPTAVAINFLEEKMAFWNSSLDENEKTEKRSEKSNWKDFGSFLDRLVRGEVKFEKKNLKEFSPKKDKSETGKEL